MQSIQLSHEELLLLLGALRLPLPLALGENPTAGHDERTLAAALAGAMSSLVARELLLADDPDADPRPAPELCALLTASALAEHCLLLTMRQGERRSATHYSLHQGRMVVHTSPRSGVHRLSWADPGAPLAAQLMAATAPPAAAPATAPQAAAPATASRALEAPTITPRAAAPPLSFAVDATPFAVALDALSGGQAQAALDILKTAGVAADLADSFVVRAGPAPAHFAVVRLSELQGPHPRAESAMVLQGLNETWYVAEPPAMRGRFLVETVNPETLLARLDALLPALT